MPQELKTVKSKKRYFTVLACTVRQLEGPIPYRTVSRTVLRLPGEREYREHLCTELPRALAISRRNGVVPILQKMLPFLGEKR